MEKRILIELWQYYIERFWPQQADDIMRMTELQERFQQVWYRYDSGDDWALDSLLSILREVPIRRKKTRALDFFEAHPELLKQYLTTEIEGKNVLRWVFGCLYRVQPTDVAEALGTIGEELKAHSLYDGFNRWSYSLLLWFFHPSRYGYYIRDIRAVIFAKLMGWSLRRIIFQHSLHASIHVAAFEELVKEMYRELADADAFRLLSRVGTLVPAGRPLQMAALSDFIETMGRFLNEGEGKASFPGLKLRYLGDVPAFRPEQPERGHRVIPGDDIRFNEPGSPSRNEVSVGTPPPGTDGEIIQGGGSDHSEEVEAAFRRDSAIASRPAQAAAPVSSVWDESFGGMNLIVFGAPGVGKSTFIKEKILGDIPPERVRRVVFHQDYTNAEFVGQFMPRGKGADVTYDFEPGPLCLSIRDALADKDHHHYLVVEEINRGPAAAIFGEAFQLLDRNEDGASFFPIVHPDAASYIYSQEEKKQTIALPPNLTLVATMNSADQNVGTLDNAFLRRWYMHLVENDFDKHEAHRDTKIEDTGVTWGHFCEVINQLITEKQIGMLSTDDKRLGVFFMKQEELKPGARTNAHPILQKEIQPRLFVAKVLRYLWDDVFRLDRASVFAVSTFEDVMQGFRKADGRERFSVLTEEVRKKLYSEDS